MARLDGPIAALYEESAREVVLQTGGPIKLCRQDGSAKVLVSLALSSSQIIGAITEILPSDLKAQFPGGSLIFPYPSPSGAVMVKVDGDEAHLEVVVTPYGPPRKKLSEESLFADLGEFEAPASSFDATAVDSHEEPREEAVEAAGEDAEQSERLELATPAEMLGLAAQPGLARWQAPVALERFEDELALAQEPAEAAEPLPPVRAAPVRPATPRIEQPARRVSGPIDPQDSARLEKLLGVMLDLRASDLHLASGAPPTVRVDGAIQPIDGWPALPPERLEPMLWSIAPEKNREEWERIKDTDFAYETERARFRVNVFTDRRGIGAVLRQIPNQILTVEQLGLPQAVIDLCHLTKGLVLVTGPTGSGKSTTLASLIDFINRTRSDHIITIEDPIEFVHHNKRCLVNQREVGTHTSSFKHALRAALREDPDVILVGELRDLETIATAIETAETGHLVFGTLHTNTAASTVDRIIDQFPADRQSQIRMMLSESLKGVVSQTLCRKVGGGRVPALEVLLVTSSVSNLIREGKTYQIPSIMQTARAQGMALLNDVLLDLVKRRLVHPRDAYAKAVAKGEFRSMLERLGVKLDEIAAEGAGAPAAREPSKPAAAPPAAQPKPAPRP